MHYTNHSSTAFKNLTWRVDGTPIPPIEKTQPF